MKELLRNQDKMYVLFEEEDGSYILSAMCGGVGMYEVRVRLNSDEVARYDAEGVDFIENLAHDISRETSKYEDRIVS